MQMRVGADAGGTELVPAQIAYLGVAVLGVAVLGGAVGLKADTPMRQALNPQSEVSMQVREQKLHCLVLCKKGYTDYGWDGGECDHSARALANDYICRANYNAHSQAVCQSPFAGRSQSRRRGGEWWRRCVRVQLPM
jgi:hypothetical protein